MDSIRSEVENAIKLLGISRKRAAEVSKLEYSAILRKIEKSFYEMYPSEMCRILDECSLCDIYICSKKLDWLVSENHSGGLYFVGEITPPLSLMQ